MSALAGVVEGYEEARARGLVMKAKIEEMRSQREKEIQSAKEKNRQIEEMNTAADRKWQLNMERYKRGEKDQNGSPIDLQYRPKPVDLVKVPDAFKEPQTVGQYAVGKAKEWGEKAIEYIGGQLKNFGIQDVKKGQGSQDEPIGSGKFEQPVRDKAGDGIDSDFGIDMNKFGQIDKESYDAAGYADGGVIRRGVARFEDGTMGGVEEAAAAQGVVPPEAQTARPASGVAAPAAPARQAAYSGVDRGLSPQLREVPPSPFDMLSQTDDAAAKAVKSIGQDPDRYMRLLNEDKTLRLSEILNRSNFKSEDYDQAVQTFNFLENQGIYGALNLARTNKRQAIEFLSKRSGEPISDIIPVPMSYKNETGEELKYTNFKIVGKDGSSSMFDTRNLLMQTFSLAKLIDQEGKWVDDIIKVKNAEIANETRKEIARGNAEIRANNKTQAQDARERENLRKMDNDISKDMQRLEEKSLDASLVLGQKGQMSAMLGVDSTNAEAYNQLMKNIQRETASRVSLRREEYGEDFEGLRKFRKNLPSIWIETAQQVAKDMKDTAQSRIVSDINDEFSMKYGEDFTSPKFSLDNSNKKLADFLLQKYKTDSGLRAQVNAFNGLPIGAGKESSSVKKAVSLLTGGRFDYNPETKKLVPARKAD